MTPPEAPPPAAVDWQRLHLVSPLLNAMVTAVRAWPVVLVAILNAENAIFSFGLLGIGVALVLTAAVVRYLRFEYKLEGTTLVVRSGVFVRTTRTVPADRVQQVSRNEKLRHRLFDVAEVAVEVAGAGTEPDVSLSVVSIDEAERIRVRLQDARRAVGAAPPTPDTVLFEQPNNSLVRWAAISSPLFLLPAFGAAVGALSEAVDLEEAWSWLPDGSQLWFIVAAAVVGLAVATAINVIRFYEMRLVKADDTLRLEYGLLTHRRLELPSDRIQAIVTRLSPAGRLSGTLGLTAHNASSGGEATNSYLPAVPQAERRRLVEWLIPGVAVDAPISGHPKAALRRSILRWLRPVIPPALAAWLLVPVTWSPVFLLAVIPAALLGGRAWRVLGHGANEDVVVSRRGAITDHVAAVRRSRVQSTSVRANWFQRRAGLATLQIEMAQPLGRVVIRDMAAVAAGSMAEELATTLRLLQRAESLEGGQGEEDEHAEQEHSL